MKLSIIIIGDEILMGQVADTNSGHIARALGALGFEVKRIVTVGDNGPDIAQAIAAAIADSDMIVTTGGLGPTKDDITKSVLADIFGCDMRQDEDALANVRRVFEARGLPINESTLSQAIVPDACTVIQNELGTAPIMAFDTPRGGWLVSLPGVPFEAVGMLGRAIVPMAAKRFLPDSLLLHHTIIARGLAESALSERLEPFEAALPKGVHLAYLPTPGYVRLRLDGIYPAGCIDTGFAELVEALKQAVGPYLLHDGDATPAEIVIGKLRACGWTMATAESCTGGNIAHSITAVAGCSDVYNGGVVSYSNEVKTRVLGVDSPTIRALGAVSEEVARQMATGAMLRCDADCAVATTGIAGPGGGTPDKPVGTVWICAATRTASTTRLLHLPGDRPRVIDRTTTEALLLLASLLPA